MGKSLKFKYIAKHSLTIAQLLYENQNILRYMNYLTDDPLSNRTINRKGQIVEQPDINLGFDESGLNTGCFNKDILTETKCHLFIHPIKSNGMRTSKIIGELQYGIDIITPSGFQILADSREYRDFNIADEISQLIDGKAVTGVGDVEINDFSSGKLDSEYCYLTLFVSIKNFTIKDVSIS